MPHNFQPHVPGMSRYRKRGRISMHGYAPGLDYSRLRRGNISAPGTGHAAQFNDDEYEALSHAQEYDLGHPFYQFGGPAYRRSALGHEMNVAETPLLRFPAPRDGLQPVEPEIDSDLAGWLLRRFVNEPSGETAVSGARSPGVSDW